MTSFIFQIGAAAKAGDVKLEKLIDPQHNRVLLLERLHAGPDD